jgi:beta-alanine degradation protein BauB
MPTPTVMITLSGFDRRLTVGELSREVSLAPGEVRWLDAQTHSGENVGGSATHVIFVELKEPARSPQAPEARLGPSEPPD